MLRANLASGATLSFDLERPEDFVRWSDLVFDPAFHRDVRGLQLARPSGVVTLPRPSLPGAMTWGADLDIVGGRVARERVTVYAGGVRITLSLFTREPCTSRVDVERVGRLVLPAPRPTR